MKTALAKKVIILARRTKLISCFVLNVLYIKKMGMADRVISPKIPVSPKALKKSLSVASPSEPGPVPIRGFS